MRGNKSEEKIYILIIKSLDRSFLWIINLVVSVGVWARMGVGGWGGGRGGMKDDGGGRGGAKLINS